jgi:hypothetical protein
MTRRSTPWTLPGSLAVSARSPGTQQLYEGLGFRVWGREPEATEIDGHRYDELYMTRRL